MLKLLISFNGAELDYSKYVDFKRVKISESINIPSTMTMPITITQGGVAIPPLRAYVKLYSTIFDRNVFTGFISSPPVRKYLGRANPATVPAEALSQMIEYQFMCTSDEHLLNIKAIPFIPQYVNRTQGEILSSIANILCPGFFDTSEIQDGDLVPYFEYTPSQSWCEIAKQFGDGSRYRYKVRDKKIWYTPYGDQPFGIAYDETGNKAMFDAFALDTTILQVPTVNDITIIGDAEAGNNREDYFIGDGFTGNYPLLHKVFRGSTSLLLQESWQENQLNTQNWFLLDPFTQFDFTAGALNVVSTQVTPDPFGSSYLQYNNAVELAGGVDIQNGEITFNDYCLGMIGGLYSDETMSSNALLGGFSITTPGSVVTSASGAGGIQIQPVWGGQNVGPAVVTVPNHTYVLNMTVHAPVYSRYDKMYRTIEGEEYGGIERDTTGSVTFYIQDYDITAATGFFYTPNITTATIENQTFPAFAVFALVNNQKLNVTIGNSTIAIMPLGGLTAQVGPSGLFQPTGAILPMLPADGSGQYPGPVLPWPAAGSGNIALPPMQLSPEFQVQVLGNGLDLQAAQISQGNDADTLAFYGQSLPAAGTPIRLQTWEQQAAVSRLQNQASIIAEAAVVGDDGIRSAIVTDLNPLPRTSEDCDNAALAYLADRGSTQYNGTYTCTSKFFVGLSSDLQFYPTCGRFLNVNAPGRGITQQKFLVTQLDITVLDAVGQPDGEILQYSITFGVDLFLEKVLKHFVDLNPAIPLTPQDKANPPNPRYTQNVDNSFLPDINEMLPAVITDTDVTISLINAQQYRIEVRNVDGNWGLPTVDLVGSFAGPTFTLSRQQFDRVWYMRYSQGGVFSRRSKVVRVRYPLQPSPPTFISALQTAGPGPSGVPTNSFQLQFDYNGDIRSIYGFELRAADNKTILYQGPATSYALLNVDLLNQTPMAYLSSPLNNDFALYAYFFNHHWSYSEPLVVDAQLILTGSRNPYLLSPAYATPLNPGDPMVTGTSFGVQPIYTTDANGNAVASVAIKAKLPATIASAIANEPVLESATGTTGGSLPAGTYILALAGLDTATPQGTSPLSDQLTVTVPASGKINFTLIEPDSPGGAEIYLASPDIEHRWYYQGSLAAGVLSGSITGFATSTPGAPDTLLDHLEIQFTKIEHGGIIGTPIYAVTSNTLALQGAQFNTNDLAGRIVSLYARQFAGEDVPILDFEITGNDNSANCVLALTTNGIDLRTVFSVGDVVVVRIQMQSITATGFTEALFVNNLNTGTPQTVASLTSVGTVATVNLPGHGLQANQAILVAGATPTGYNGQFLIASVLDADNFTYNLAGSLASPATGTITVATQGAVINGEVGRVVLIIEGTGKGQRRIIQSNTSTQFTLTAAWDTLPDSTSIVIIIDPQIQPAFDTHPLVVPNRTAVSGLVATINLENLSDVAWLFRLLTADSNDNYDNSTWVPYREIYFTGSQGQYVSGLITSVSATEVSADRSNNADQQLQIVIAVTPILVATAPVGTPISFWFDKADGNGWTYAGTWGYQGGSETINITELAPLNNAQGNWKVAAATGVFGPTDQPPAGFVQSTVGVYAITTLPNSVITNAQFLDNPTTNDIFQYALTGQAGIYLWDFYELDWDQPTISQSPDYWNSILTVQLGDPVLSNGPVTVSSDGLKVTGNWLGNYPAAGMEIRVGPSGAVGASSLVLSTVLSASGNVATLTTPVAAVTGQWAELWFQSPDYQGADDDIQLYKGRLVTDAGTVEGGVPVPGTTVQLFGAVPANWGVPPKYTVDGGTNPYRTFRFRIFAITKAAQNPDGTYNWSTLQWCWPGGADHYDLVPALQPPGLDLRETNPVSLGRGVVKNGTSLLLETRLGNGLNFDGSGNNQANLGYTMQINGSGQIVLGNLQAVYGLPTPGAPNYPQGSVILNTADYKIYRNTTGSAWVKSSDPADLVAGAVASGVTIAASQITAGSLLAGVIYTGTLTASQVISGQFTGLSMVLNLNGITTTLGNIFDSGVNKYVGLKVADTSGNYGVLYADGGWAWDSSHSASAFYTADPSSGVSEIGVQRGGYEGIVYIDSNLRGTLSLTSSLGSVVMYPTYLKLDTNNIWQTQGTWTGLMVSGIKSYFNRAADDNSAATMQITANSSNFALSITSAGSSTSCFNIYASAGVAIIGVNGAQSVPNGETVTTSGGTRYIRGGIICSS
ncbi:MAG: hypothetical protein KGL39_25525 [Patescibacteria group bacterium]|nr:hypothetical protein [Patescibacteria group bacterium]